MWKKAEIISGSMFALETVLIVTSPWTGYIAYFDENYEYQHGPMFLLFYIFAAILLAFSLIMVILERKKFNLYQTINIIAYVVITIVCVGMQAVYPRAMISQLGCALVLYFIYMSFENPMFFTFMDTSCYNQHTFMLNLKNLKYEGEKVSMVVFAIRDYAYVKRVLSIKDKRKLSNRVADFVYLTFGDSGYAIDEDKFVIILDQDMDYNQTSRLIDEYFASPIKLIDMDVNVRCSHWYVKDIEFKRDGEDILDTDDVLDSIEYIIDKTNPVKDEIVDIDNITQRMHRKHEVAHAVERAIAGETFEVYYQPIYDVAEGSFTCSEALVRLKDDKLGFISPEEFIPMAEDDGSILDIGDIVFKKVCEFIKETQCTLGSGVHYIEVNLSPVQCVHENIVDRLRAIMKKYGVSPAWINFEITETAQYNEDESMHHNIEKLYDNGSKFSIDDYGSGFASADYLFKLPVDIVKIDKGILWQAMENPNAMVVLKNTMKMVKELGKKIVVEGVENQEMVDILKSFGCDYMQGYFFSKPVPAEDYMKFLDEKN
jgi:EAL domain-containing protein (putative c-di-GMP-specific phosphodiesterase class I)